MKALGKLKPGKGLTLYEAPVPEIGSNDLLIQIEKTAICGTDINIYEWKEWAQKNVATPLTVGHEFVGVICKMGEKVEGFQIGDRVSGEGHLVCKTCRNCRAGREHLCKNTVGLGYHRTGCFAQYLALPASNAYKIPEDIPDEVAAILDPLGNAVHTALSFDLAGEDVLITGAGPIGIMTIKLARFLGARHIVITEINEERLKLAQKEGATRAINPTKTSLEQVMKELGMREGFDVGLEVSGSPSALNDIIASINHGGKIALLGILPSFVGVDWISVVFKSLTLKGIYGREMYETWYKMTSFLQSGLDVSSVITHQFPAEEFEKAFSTMRGGSCGKIILDWSYLNPKKEKQESQQKDLERVLSLK